MQKSNIKGSNLSIDAQEVATPSPSTKLQTGHVHSMLMKLVAESDSKSVAFTEEVNYCAMLCYYYCHHESANQMSV